MFAHSTGHAPLEVLAQRMVVMQEPSLPPACSQLQHRTPAGSAPCPASSVWLQSLTRVAELSAPGVCACGQLPQGTPMPMLGCSASVLVSGNSPVSRELFPCSVYQQLPAALKCSAAGDHPWQLSKTGMLSWFHVLGHHAFWSRRSSLILRLCVQWSDHLYYTALREVQVLGHLPSPSVVRDFVRCQRVCSSLPQKVTEASDPQQLAEQPCERALPGKQGQRADGICLYSAVHQLPLSDKPPDIEVGA